MNNREVISFDMAKHLVGKYDLYHATKCYTAGVGFTGWYLDLTFNMDNGTGEVFTNTAVHYRLHCNSFSDCDVKRNLLWRVYAG